MKPVTSTPISKDGSLSPRTGVWTYSVLVALLTACSGNGQPPKDQRTPAVHEIDSGYVRIDLRDTGYAGVEEFAQDTVTPDGWSITYLVKDDSTRYDDLYIRWAKNDRHGLFKSASTLMMRRFFIPVYVGENSTHLFLQHGCSTSDEAMLVLSKDSLPQGRDVGVVFDHDLALGQIAYVPERSFSLDTLEVSVVDFTRGQERSVIFMNHCDLAPDHGCIDSVSFSPQQTTFFATLRDNHGHPVKEMQVATFDEGARMR